MKNFMIWLGFVCCSIIGGYTWAELESVERSLLLSLLACLSVLLLTLHDRLSKKLKKQSFPIFRVTTIIGILVTIGVFLCQKEQYSDLTRFFWLTLTIICGIAAVHESRYTE